MKPTYLDYMNEFDETKAIDAMRRSLPAGAPDYDDDQLLNVLDMIWDFYEQNGMLDLDVDDSEPEDEAAVVDELTDYVGRMLKKDKDARIAPEHIKSLILAEIAYEDSLLD